MVVHRLCAQCGVDVTMLAYRDALGLPVESVTGYPVGARCVLLHLDLQRIPPRAEDVRTRRVHLGEVRDRRQAVGLLVARSVAGMEPSAARRAPRLRHRRAAANPVDPAEITDGRLRTQRRGDVASFVVEELEHGDCGTAGRPRVATAEMGSAYGLPGYVDVVRDVTGGGMRVVVARRGDEIAGGLTILERKAPIGTFVSPRLLMYYNGFVLRDYETRYPSERVARQLEVVAALAEHVATLGYGSLALRREARSPTLAH